MGKPKMYKKPYFALSKCFIAPPAADFPMPPKHWTTSPVNETCAIEACAIRYISTTTSYAINDLFLYHMKEKVNIEISANKRVNSTSSSTDFKCKVSYNMEINVNIKTCGELEGINESLKNSINNKKMSNGKTIKYSKKILNVKKENGINKHTNKLIITACEELEGSNKPLYNRNKLNIKTCEELERSNKPLYNTNKLNFKTCEELERYNKPLYNTNKLNFKTCEELERSNKLRQNENKLNIKTCEKLATTKNSLNNTSIHVTYEEFEGFINWINNSSMVKFNSFRKFESINYSLSKSFSVHSVIA